MNRTVTILALAVALLGAALAQTTAYTNKTHGFSLEVPANWQPLPDAQARQFGLAAAFRAQPNPSGFATNLNVVVQTTPQPMTLAAYVEANTKQLSSFITNYQPVSRDDNARLGGRRATQLVYRGTQGKFDLEFVQYIALDRVRFVTLTFTAEAAGAEVYRPLYEGVRSSLKFL